MVGIDVHALAPTDSSTGKWNALVKGAPNEYSKMILVLVKKENTLTGLVQDIDVKEHSKVDRVELSGDAVIVYCTYCTETGYSLNLELT